MQVEHAGYLITDDPARLDAVAIHAYLARSYWAEGIPLETVRQALQGSLCIGIYTSGGAQIGLVRVISDFATYAYFCDVYVLEAHRGKGLAKAAMKAAMDHPRLQGRRRLGLVTRDAHGLYEQFGFKTVAQPERHMEKLNRSIYPKPASPA